MSDTAIVVEDLEKRFGDVVALGGISFEVPSATVLGLLGPNGAGKTMGSLAGEWTCDASNATWIIDRLEKRGLAERRPSPGDRRVKMVVLTPLGAKTRAAVMAEMFKPPSALLELDRQDLEALRDAARKLAAMVKPPEDSAASG